MDELVRLRLESDVDVQDFLSFLDFHQFHYETEEEEILNVKTMVNEKASIVLIEENKLEEFKVLVLVYKDLLANKNQRNLNIPIENSLIDYEKTRKINTIELLDEEQPEGDEIFKRANKGEVPDVKDMEDSFYGYKKKKKDGKPDLLEVVLNKEDLKEKDIMSDESISTDRDFSFLKEILKLIGLLVFTGFLVLIFLLIR